MFSAPRFENWKGSTHINVQLMYARCHQTAISAHCTTIQAMRPLLYVPFSSWVQEGTTPDLTLIGEPETRAGSVHMPSRKS